MMIEIMKRQIGLLHDAIKAGDRAKVARLVIDERVSPLAQLDGSNALEVSLRALPITYGDKRTAARSILENVLLPRVDQILIGNAQAWREDWMVLESDGSWEIVLGDRDQPVQDDGARVRRVGTEDYKLSRDFRDQTEQHEFNAQEDPEQIWGVVPVV